MNNAISFEGRFDVTIILPRVAFGSRHMALQMRHEILRPVLESYQSLTTYSLTKHLIILKLS